jgi:5-hydroxyisourate hydrolase
MREVGAVGDGAFALRRTAPAAYNAADEREIMGRLTTHVLDTAHGRPAAAVEVAVYRNLGGDPGERYALLETAVTNADGRCDAPLLEGDAFTAGRYRLVFQAGAYFAALGIALPEPPFVDAVVVDFGIADAAAHYHVPLLVSPWGWSTYRGS